MRILLTADAELPVPPKLYGGIERIIDALVAEFRRRGHVVGLLAHPASTCECDAFYAWPGSSSTKQPDSWRNAWALRRVTLQFQPEIVHSFSRLLWLLPLLGSGVPRIMSYQREPTQMTVNWSRRIHGHCLHFTGCSEHIAATGAARGGGSWSAIPNFIDPEIFTFVPTVPADAPLVFLSRVERIKGAHTAIQIAKASGRQLKIAGNRVDSPEGQSYWNNEIAPHLGRDGIEYVGPVNDDEKNQLLGKAAAMVVPIEWEEPFGIVFAESLACGTPVISTPRGSLPEIVTPGSTGMLINSVEAGVQAVAQLDTLSRKVCRNTVESRFSLPVVADRYLQLYRNMQSPPPA